MEETPLFILLGALFVLLLCSAIFSASETSMMALNRYRLNNLAKQGHRGARFAAALLAKTDKLLGVILLGNNLINAAAASLVTVITLRLFGEHNEWALTIGTLVVTFLILVFSEVTPKVLAATYPEKIAYKAAYLLTPLLKIAYPVVWFVNLFVRALLWLLRIKPNNGESTALSLEDLRMMVLESQTLFVHKHRSMLVNLLDVQKITVDHVMTPRQHIEAIDLMSAPEVLREQLSTCHHTRLMVYCGKLDDVRGILHTRKILQLSSQDDLDRAGLESILREPYFIPSGTSVLAQLQHFQENQRRLGLVVDEYGELMGLVTLEDILEEIIGEFTTQTPMRAQRGRVAEDGSLLVEGSALLRDLNRRHQLELPLEGPNTINGLLLEHFQAIPEVGTCMQIGAYRFEVLQTQGRSVRMVRIYPSSPQLFPSA